MVSYYFVNDYDVDIIIKISLFNNTNCYDLTNQSTWGKNKINFEKDFNLIVSDFDYENSHYIRDIQNSIKYYNNKINIKIFSVLGSASSLYVYKDLFKINTKTGVSNGIITEYHNIFLLLGYDDTHDNRLLKEIIDKYGNYDKFTELLKIPFDVFKKTIGSFYVQLGINRNNDTKIFYNYTSPKYGYNNNLISKLTINDIKDNVTSEILEYYNDELIVKEVERKIREENDKLASLFRQNYINKHLHIQEPNYDYNINDFYQKLNNKFYLNDLGNLDEFILNK